MGRAPLMGEGDLTTGAGQTGDFPGSSDNGTIALLFSLFELIL